MAVKADAALVGKRVALFVDFQHEDMEVQYPLFRLREEGAEVVVVSSKPVGTKITGKFGYPVPSQAHCDGINPDDYHGVVLPGGFAPDYMRREKGMLTFIEALHAARKPVAAICHGPWMLCSAKKQHPTDAARRVPLCFGLRTTSFVAIKDDVENAGGVFVDEPVVCDENVITSRTPNDLIAWTLKIIERVRAVA